MKSLKMMFHEEKYYTRRIKKVDKMTKNSTMFIISIPIFIESLMQLLVGNVDQIMVGWHSNASVGAIVNGNQIMNLVITTINTLCIATTVILTQYLGANDREKSNKISVLSTAFIGFIGLIISCICVFFGRVIFELMNIDSMIFDETCLYLMIVGGTTFFQALHMNFVAILRSYTRIKEVMYVSICMNILNVIGNTVLINGFFGFPCLGVTGAAISTAVSKVTGFILVCIMIKKYTNVELKWKDMTDSCREMFLKYLGIGLPTGAENISYYLSQAFILGIINPYGAIVVAAKGYCEILANVSYMYGGAIAQASQIVIGHLIGKKQLDEVESKVWFATKTGIVTSSGIMFLLWMFSDHVFGIFTQDPTILAIGKQVLFLDIFLEAGRSINNTLTRSFIALGEIKLPMTVGISFQWIVGFGLSVVFGGILGFGLPGVWLAMMLDECLRGLIYTVTFRRNKWKQKLLS